MDRLVINGPAKLSGSVCVSPAKNACLPIMTACLLNPNPITLKDMPTLKDVETLRNLLESLGVKSEVDQKDIRFDAGTIESTDAEYELVRKMRDSILVLGPLLARERCAKVSLPGGCAIGTRPIDIHLEGLKKMGAVIDINSGYVFAKTGTEGLVGAQIVLPFPSVGATENLMMAAVLAKGETTITNAAREPEIEDLGNFLNAMGAIVEGAGESIIKIQGVHIDKLKSVSYRAIGDRIEAATYLIAGIITNSEIEVKGFRTKDIASVCDELQSMGAVFEVAEDQIVVKKHDEIKGCNVDTAPFPGFPTDVQAQMMVLATKAITSSVIREKIFENRFMHVPELKRMGANIIKKGNLAMIEGSASLSAAPVMCTDLRASAALVLAALAAEGETVISRVYHLDRGYENLADKLSGLGVDIKRI